MKPHIRIKLRNPARRLLGWQNMLKQRLKASQNVRFIPSVDALMQQYNLPYISTQEFEPQNKNWNQEEISTSLNRVYRLILCENTRIPEQLIQQIRLIPEVIDVQPIQVGRMELPRTYSLSKRTDDQSRKAIYLPEAHNYTQGSSKVIIAVLDTGIETTHRELDHAMLPGMDFVNIIDGAEDFIGDYLGIDSDPSDAVGHGTHIAGIIAAKGLGMPKGVSPRCKILPVRVLAAMQQGEKRVGAGVIPNIDAGIKYAVDKGANIINMSLGVIHEGGGLPHREIIDYATRKGVTLVAASGNDGQEKLYYPGAYDSVIAVGAVGRDAPVAAFSTYGRQVSIVAPGEGIYSTFLNGEYAFSSGTSHAAPFVSGGIGLLKSYAIQKGKDLMDHQVKYLLKHTSDKVSKGFKHHKAGFGRLNLWDAFQLLEAKL